MTKYTVELQAPMSASFLGTKAANSLDIDVSSKSRHSLTIDATWPDDWSVGLVVGASGSGKTTLARQIWGDDSMTLEIDEATAVIDQFPEGMEYNDIANFLNGVGLSQVPCWLRPVHTLSNGQKERAKVALAMATKQSPIVIDEWTSVVDRTVAKIMSHSAQKYARRKNTTMVFVSCHFDVKDWLQPDWVIDCNRGNFRRCLRRGRQERLAFEIAECDRSTWHRFSRYHYLSDRLPGGHIETFGLYHKGDQVGFQCFANYVPHRLGTVMQMHFNRTVVHPDYVGLGIGIEMINHTSALMARRGYDVRGKFSSVPVAKALAKSPQWRLLNEQRTLKTPKAGNMNRSKSIKSGLREKVRTVSYKWIGGKTYTSETA